MIFQGLINDQTSPRKADTYATPTHQITQMNVGAKLYMGSGLPKKPTNTNKTKRKTLESWIGKDAPGQLRILAAFHCSNFILG
jgi:hypothetical protein